MEMKKIIGVFVAVTVGIVMLSAVLMPVISDSLVLTGDKITVSNQSFNSYYKEADNGDVITVTDTTADLNGGSITTFTYRGAVYADKMYIYLLGAPSNGNIGFIVDDSGIDNQFVLVEGRTWTISYENGTISVKGALSGQSDLTYSKSGLEWCFMMSTPIDGTYQTIKDIRYSDAYTTNPAKQVICSGYYETGENDTFYSYRNGKLIQNTNTDYQMSIGFDTSIKSGTTDIYDTVVNISIGDETFTPFLFLVPGEVVGHADSGGAHNILLTIPLIFIVALISIFVMVIRNRD